MPVYENVLQLIGNTPLVRLSRLEKSFGSGAKVYAKLERSNPGGSAKDRVAVSMLRDAEQNGRLRSGDVIVEPTSGNTGVGLALVCAYLGYKLILTMPESMSRERRDLLSAYGAEIVLTPAADGMQGAVREANRLVGKLHAFCPSQFDNPANPAAHKATAKEIFSDLLGQIDVFAATVGTGGTLCGTVRALRELGAAPYTVAVEPAESPLLSGGKAGAHGIQGIGANFIPANYDPSLVDEIFCATTQESAEMARRLAREEGLLCGISSGAAALAALRLSVRGEYCDKNIVCVLPDTGERYLSAGVF